MKKTNILIIILLLTFIIPLLFAKDFFGIDNVFTIIPIFFNLKLPFFIIPGLVFWIFAFIVILITNIFNYFSTKKKTATFN